MLVVCLWGFRKWAAPNYIFQPLAAGPETEAKTKPHPPQTPHTGKVSTRGCCRVPSRHRNHSALVWGQAVKSGPTGGMAPSCPGLGLAKLKTQSTMCKALLEADPMEQGVVRREAHQEGPGPDSAWCRLGNCRHVWGEAPECLERILGAGL